MIMKFLGKKSIIRAFHGRGSNTRTTEVHEPIPVLGILCLAISTSLFKNETEHGPNVLPSVGLIQDLQVVAGPLKHTSCHSLCRNSAYRKISRLAVMAAFTPCKFFPTSRKGIVPPLVGRPSMQLGLGLAHCLGVHQTYWWHRSLRQELNITPSVHSHITSSQSFTVSTNQTL